MIQNAVLYSVVMWRINLRTVLVALTLLTIGLMDPSQVFASHENVTCGQTITESVRLTSDLLNCTGNGIVIGTDNITLDGNGHTLDGVGVGSGVVLTGKKGVSVINLRVAEFSIGVSLFNSVENKISNNSFRANNRGIRLATSKNNTISMNAFSSNFLAIRVLFSSNDNVVTSNTVSGTTANAINLHFSNDNIVDNNTVSNNGRGISLFESNDNIITRNTVTNNTVNGFRLVFSDDNTIEWNESENNGAIGFLLEDSDGNTFKQNESEENGGDGFRVDQTSGDNTFLVNSSNSNRGYGFVDTSLGTGSSGTENKYFGNLCRFNIRGKSSPPGLCKP